MHGSYWSRFNVRERRLSRRGLFRGVSQAAAGIAGLAFLGCSDPGEDGGGFTIASESSTPAAGALEGTATAEAMAGVRSGGTWRAALTNDPPTIDPFANQSFVTKSVAAHVYSRLYRIAANSDQSPYAVGVEPDLAESAETADGREWIVRLKPGVRFQNLPPVGGREVTSADVIESVRRLMADDSPSRDMVSNWRTIEAIDDHTISFTLDAPNGVFLEDLADASRLVIMPQESFDGRVDPAVMALGSGPWILEEYQHGSSLRFVRNPDFWDQPRPYLDAIEYSIIADHQDAVAAFRAGNLSMLGVTAADLLDLRSDETALQWRGQVTALLAFLYFSPEDREPDAPWRDDRFRQAVSMLTDRDALTEAGYGVSALHAAGLEADVVWNNIVSAGWSRWWLDPRSPAMGDAAQFFAHNPAEAQRLLDASGYGGEEVTYQYADNIYPAAFNTIADATGQQLVAGGINARVELQDYNSVYFPDTFRGEFDGIAYGLETQFSEVGGYFPRLFGDDPANHGRIQDDDITELISRQAAELNVDERRELIHEIQRVNARHMYYVPGQAGAGLAWTAYAPEVRGITQTRGYGAGAETLPNAWLDV